MNKVIISAIIYFSFLIDYSISKMCGYINSGLNIDKETCFSASLSDKDKEIGYDSCCYFEATIDEQRASMCKSFYKDIEKIRIYIKNITNEDSMKNIKFDCSSKYFNLNILFIFVVFVIGLQ